MSINDKATLGIQRFSGLRFIKFLTFHFGRRVVFWNEKTWQKFFRKMIPGENSIEFINQEGGLLKMKSPPEIFFTKPF
jgi:hypothetical protein